VTSRTVLFGLLWLLVPTAACSSFGSGSTPIESTADGGGLTSDPDGGSTSPPDGGGGGEGDASSSTRWCDRNAADATACLDFDGLPTSDPVERGWGSLEQNNGGAIVRDQNEMLLTVQAGSVNPHARLMRQIPSFKATFSLAFDFRPELAGQQGDGKLAHIVEIKQGNILLALYHAEGTLLLQEYVAPSVTQDQGATPLALNTTYRIELRLNNNTMRVRVNAGAETTIPTTIDPNLPTLINLGIGNTNGSARAWRSRYDNIVLRAK